MAADPVTKNTVDDLFNVDWDSDDLFGEKPTKDKGRLSSLAAKRKADDEDDEKENFGLGLGLDEEVKITKQRKPNPKLDEARLLSRPGIPKLRELARSGISKKLRFKGKGHEFSDTAKLLNYFQLWLDDLYPRAKFADGLQMVEKVGHSKRMQVMRREWINESKIGFAKDDFSREDERARNATAAGTTKTNASTEKEQDDAQLDDPDDMFFPDTSKQQDRPVEDGEPDDDELDALLAEQPAPRPKAQQKPAESESEGEDDLDALIAEQESRRAPTKAPEPASVINEGNDKDDLDTLLAEQEARNEFGASAWNEPPTATDEDDLDAMFAEQEAMGGALSLRLA